MGKPLNENTKEQVPGEKSGVSADLAAENLSPADEQDHSSVESETESPDNAASPSSEDENENLSRSTIEYRMRQYNRKLDRKLETFESRIVDAISRNFGQQGSAQPTEMAEPEQKGNVSPADVQKMVEQELQNRKMQEVQQGEQKINDAFIAKENQMSDKYEDYDDVIEGLKVKGHITSAMVNSMKYDPNSVDVLYKVGKENPQLLENISKLSPMQQGVEVGKLMAGFAKPNQAPIKPAPHKPLSPVNNKGGSMSQGGNNYAFDDRLAELAAGKRTSR